MGHPKLNKLSFPTPPWVMLPGALMCVSREVVPCCFDFATRSQKRLKRAGESTASRLYAVRQLLRGLRTRECYKDSPHPIPAVICNEYPEPQTVKSMVKNFEATPHLIRVLNPSKCERPPAICVCFVPQQLRSYSRTGLQVLTLSEAMWNHSWRAVPCRAGWGKAALPSGAAGGRSITVLFSGGLGASSTGVTFRLLRL
jgi:hypothetical protein